MFSSSDHHRPVRREAVLLHGSDHRPVVVVRVHRRRGAAVGTGEARNRRRPEKGKKIKSASRGRENGGDGGAIVAANCCLSNSAAAAAGLPSQPSPW